MNWFLTLFLGFVVAQAVRRKNDSCSVGWQWRVLAGATAATFPHLASAIAAINPMFAMRLADGALWSPLMAPFWALGLAHVFGLLGRRPWTCFYPIAITALGLSVALKLFTFEGSRLFWPLTDFRTGIGLMFGLDITLTAILMATSALFLVFPKFKRDIARAGLLICVVYVVVIGTFYWKASAVGWRYQEALGLQNADLFVLPQPISALNWRLIVTDNQNRLHDTRVNIFRKDELEVGDTSTRAWRIHAQYKPVNQAVWSIYRRFGYEEREHEELQKMFNALSNSPYAAQTKFAIFNGWVKMSQYKCAKWQDLRKLHAKRKGAGTYLLCNTGTAYSLHKMQKNGESRRIDILKI